MTIIQWSILVGILAVLLWVSWGKITGQALHSSSALALARSKNQNASFSRRAVVIGGTSGIGRGIAVRLAQAGFSVTIIGRNADAANHIISSELNQYGSGHDFITCDARLISSIKTAVKAFTQRHQQLDVLVLSQGIGSFAGRTETAEGIDQKLALHYYGRVAFIQLLLPLLRASPSGRVLSVLSAGIHSVYSHYQTDPELKEHFSLKNAADAAGFYNDLALDALARQPQNSKVSFIHAAPGFVNTNWGTDLPLPIRFLVRVLQPLLGKSIYDCAELLSIPLLQSDASLSSSPHFILINQYGEDTVKRTELHETARDVVWRDTLRLLKSVGLEMNE